MEQKAERPNDAASRSLLHKIKKDETKRVEMC